MLVKFGAETSELDRAIENTKKNLKSFKDIGKDLKEAGQGLSMAITAPILGVTAMALAAAAEADVKVKASLASIDAAVKTTMANIGTAILPSIVTIFNALMPLLNIVNELTRAFTTLPQPLQTLIVGAAMLAAAVGPVVYVVGSLIGMYSTILPLIAAVTAANTVNAAVTMTQAGAATAAALATNNLAISEAAASTAAGGYTTSIGAATLATGGLAASVYAALGPLGLLLAALGAIAAIWTVFDVGSLFGMGNSHGKYTGAYTTTDSRTGQTVGGNASGLTIPNMTMPSSYGSGYGDNLRIMSRDELAGYANWGAAYAPSGGQGVINTQINIDGRQVAEATAPYNMDAIRRGTGWNG